MTLSHELLEVTPSGLAYICLGGFVVAFSSISLLIKEKLYINEVLLGTIFGVVVGPFCANIFDPRSWGDRTDEITLEVMRVILATGLFAIGVELPGSYMKKHAKGLLVLVVPTMAIGWVVVAAFIHLLFPNLVFISCLAIAACLTPTDPIICATIVGGNYALKHVPHNLRLLISAESAANDGLAYPFLSISIYLTVEASRRVAIGKWFLVGWLYQVILGIVLGAMMGLAFSYLMKMSHRRGYIDRESFIAQYLALALFTIGVASTIGSDDLLAAFACGNAISWDQNFNEVTEDAVFSSVIDLVLNCGCFVYIGAWMPFDAFNTPELGITPWRLVVLFIIILALRRIPSVLLLYRWVPEIKTWQEALFTGHFGPMGVGAVFVSTLARTRLPHPRNPPANQQELLAATLQPLVAFVVLGSIIIHGLSIPFFSLSGTMRNRTRSLLVTLTSTGPYEWLVGLRRGPVVVFGSKDVPNDAPALRQNNAERGEAGPAVRIVTPEPFSPEEMNVDVVIDPGVDAETRETTVDEEHRRRPVVEVAMDGVRRDVEQAQ
ncbi:Sodium/hydrogen exchanger family-domain-containing protein [Roridomyces roridus]|uniref:Sodium/hydrogen exchanger family-domain-containing protein n=1 Tax=Roridomyces roridus TaxID=1738132 RepID=A0AAD7CGK3_9AGAR|nr:Sodium/hydrogen exchanger family-domain-containing protein [Roridomyces roridus]